MPCPNARIQAWRLGQAWGQGASNTAGELDSAPGSHLRYRSRAVKITVHHRHSLSNSTGKVTQPNVGPCVGNRRHHCHLRRGPPGLGSHCYRKTRRSLCLQSNPNATCGDRGSHFIFMSWGRGAKASELAPYTQSLGPPGREEGLQEPQGGAGRGEQFLIPPGCPPCTNTF